MERPSREELEAMCREALSSPGAYRHPEQSELMSIGIRIALTNAPIKITWVMFTVFRIEGSKEFSVFLDPLPIVFCNAPISATLNDLA